MKIISIDIGIKNLAYTIIDHEVSSENFTIINWDVINLCNKIPNCNCCEKNAKYLKFDKYYCKQHTKNTEYQIPIINTKNLNKKNIKELSEIGNKYSLEIPKSNKKDLMKIIEDHINNICFDVIETPNANNIKLIDLGITLKLELNKLFTIYNLSDIDIILLENQISPIANRMKTIQGMIAQYFIDSGNYNIEFMSAANKLKLFSKTKNTTYSERKKMSIQFTQELLNKKNQEVYLDFFNKHRKKDDLADCFLQGIYYLNNFNKFIL